MIGTRPIENPFQRYQGSSDSDDGNSSSDEKEVKIPNQFKTMLKKYQEILIGENIDWKVVGYKD